MSATTSLKLPDALKATIAKIAALEGKTSHAVMVDALQAAMDDAVARQQFYAVGEASYQDTVRTNRAYRAEDVEAYVMARVAGGKPPRPRPQALDATRPMKPKHG
jgi:predicted transcriptional regulator